VIHHPEFWMESREVTLTSHSAQIVECVQIVRQRYRVLETKMSIFKDFWLIAS
jgi:hypothetical protein